MASHRDCKQVLILDYPRQALPFFAPEEAAHVDGSARITPLRQEQLQNRLGDRFHELDTPYGKLTETEQQLLVQRYPAEEKIMSTWLTTWSERMRAQIWQDARQESRQEGEATVLLRQLTRRFGPLGVPVTEQIRQASPDELEQWADNILDARSLTEVFQPR